MTRLPSSDTSSRRLHWLAMLMPVVAMLTIFFGAMTTTESAGMAFPDYPTSDGQGMFSYPFLKLLSTMSDNPDDYKKFLEHGHRLMGIVIGIYAIVVAVLSYTDDKRTYVRGLGVGILLCVIAQGLLGGFRVLLNSLGLAMLHGLFASLVLSLMGVMALVTALSWQTPSLIDSRSSLFRNRTLAVITFVALLSQYALGGMVRHHGWNPTVHLHMGITTTLFVLITAVSCWFPHHCGITRWGSYLGLAVVLQFLIGLGTFVTKYGYPPLGYVAVYGSVDQVFMRTLHMMSGTIVMAFSVQFIMQTFRSHHSIGSASTALPNSACKIVTEQM